MTTARERYLNTERGQEAAREAWRRQYEKRKQYAAEKREKIETYRNSLVGLTEKEIRDKMRQYKAYMRLREEQTKARQRDRAEYWRRQRTQQELEAKIRAERSRVDSLIRHGVVMLMTPEEKAEWLANCERLNPIMFDILKEKGIA